MYVQVANEQTEAQKAAEKRLQIEKEEMDRVLKQLREAQEEGVVGEAYYYSEPDLAEP